MTISESVLESLLAEREPEKAVADFIVDDNDNIDINILNDLCTNGGWPDEPEYTVDDTNRDGNKLEVSITVYFTEVYPGACADQPLSEPQKGGITAIVDLEDGEVEFCAHPDEFDQY